MLNEGQRPPVPSAPDALKSAIDSFKNRVPVERHIETAEYVEGKLIPLLEALSIPENLGEGRSRRQLSYAPEVTLNGNPYWLHVGQSTQADGKSSIVIEATTYSPDELRIAYIGLGVMAVTGHEFPWKMIKNGGNVLADKRDLREIREVADLIADEAPKQAVTKGKISTHWMERFNAKLPEEVGPNYKEGFPQNHSSKLYEVISWNGLRSVCSIVKAGEEHGWKDQAGQLLWLDDISQDTVQEESKVAAWRELDPIGVLPEYYARQKYPIRYRHEGISSKPTV